MFYAILSSSMNRRTLLPAVFLCVSALLLGAGCSKSVSESTSAPTKTSKTIQKGVSINPNQGSPSYTMDEIALHASSTDCFVTINDKVYDATTYVKHAKDPQRVTDVCGKDATQTLAADLESKATGTAALGTFEIGTVQR